MAMREITATGMVRSLMASSLLAGGLVGAAAGGVIDVPADEPSIQAAIDAAADGDEVVVEPGTYAEIIDFTGKAVTVRSSGGPDVTTIDATSVRDPGAGKPVVRCSSFENDDTVLQGFTIKGGTGDTDLYGIPIGGGMVIQGSPLVIDCVFTGHDGIDAGAGMAIVLGAPTIVGCRFHNNEAAYGGGGVGILEQGYPTFRNCTFEGNRVINGGRGAGLLVEIHSEAILEDCLFVDNSATGIAPPNVATGGGLYAADSEELRLRRCRFIGNSAISAGGAYLGDEGVLLDSCVFTGNTATVSDGGALLLSGSATLLNCTIAGNTAGFHGGGVFAEGATVEVTNCILFGNSDSSGSLVAAQLYPENNLTAAVNYSIVQGDWPDNDSVGNLDINPSFIDADGADNVVGTEDDDLRISAGSPAIDSGNTVAVAGNVGGTDAHGNPRLVDDPATANGGVSAFGLSIDRGAFEFGAEPASSCASDIVSSASFQPPSDGVVDAADLAYLLGEWGTCR